MQRSVVDFWHVIQQVMISDAVQGSSFLGSGPKGFDDLCFQTNREFSPTSPSSYPPPLDIEFLLATLVSLISSCIERGISYGLVTALYFHTRLDTWLHQSRAGRQEQCWRRSQEHLGRSSGLKKFKNAEKVIVAKALDGQRYPCPA